MTPQPPGGPPNVDAGITLKDFADALAGWPGGWVADRASPSYGDPLFRGLNAAMLAHQRFLQPDEAVLAIVGAPVDERSIKHATRTPGTVAAGVLPPVVFTDRKVCWINENGVHRLEYGDIRVEGVRARGEVLTVAPAVRVRRRPDTQYGLKCPTPAAAEALAGLLARLSSEAVPLAVPVLTRWMPASKAYGEHLYAAKQAKVTQPLRVAGPSVDDLRRRAATRDPGLAEALVTAGRAGSAAVSELLWELWLDGSAAARACLLDVLARVPLRWGTWRGVKRVFKDAEARRDAEVVGLIAGRVDAEDGWSRHRTRWYMRRRAWRFLRTTAHASPANYPHFAVEVLTRATGDDMRAACGLGGGTSGNSAPLRLAATPLPTSGAPPAGGPAAVPGVGAGPAHSAEPRPLRPRRWVIWHILRPGKRPASGRAVPSDPPASPRFADLWRASAEPLLRLAVKAVDGTVSGWAIRLLRTEHAAVLERLLPEQILPLLTAATEPAALLGWERLEALVPPEWVDDAVLLAALRSPLPAVTARAASFLDRHRAAGGIAPGQWVELAVGNHEAAASYALRRLRSDHAGRLPGVELERMLGAPWEQARTWAAGEIVARPPEGLTSDPDRLAAALDRPYADVRSRLTGLLMHPTTTAEAAFAVLDLPHADVRQAARKAIHLRAKEWGPQRLLPVAAESPDDDVLHWAVGAFLDAKPAPAELLSWAPALRRVMLRVNAAAGLKRRLLSSVARAAVTDASLAPLAAKWSAEFGGSVGRTEMEAALVAAVRLREVPGETGEAARGATAGWRVDDGRVAAPP